MTATEWDNLTLSDIGIKIAIPTDILEVFYERALVSLSQLERYLYVVAKELDERNA